MALAKELAPSGIQVNAIACGAIDTEMNGFLSEEEHEMLLEEIPAGRMGKPEEVADLVMKLVEAPDYLTGQVIKMDVAGSDPATISFCFKSADNPADNAHAPEAQQ